MPLPTYAPPRGVAYFTLTAAICGLDEDAVASGLSDIRAPLAVALCKFAACAAATVQPVVNSSLTFIAATLAAAPREAANSPKALPRGPVVASSADCDAWEQRGSGDDRRRHRQLPSVASAPVCTEVFARMTSTAPSAPALAALLASPGSSPIIRSSAMDVLLNPAAAVNTALTALADFFAAQVVGNATGVPALASLYTSLGAELAAVPLPAVSIAAVRRRALVASGATITILSVSPVQLIDNDLGIPPSTTPDGPAALAAAIASGVALLVLIAAGAAVIYVRRQRARRAIVRAFASEKTCSERCLAAQTLAENPLRADDASPPGIRAQAASTPGIKRAELSTCRAVLPRGTQAELLAEKLNFAARRARSGSTASLDVASTALHTSNSGLASALQVAFARSPVSRSGRELSSRFADGKDGGAAKSPPRVAAAQLPPSSAHAAVRALVGEQPEAVGGNDLAAATRQLLIARSLRNFAVAARARTRAPPSAAPAAAAAAAAAASAAEEKAT